MALNKVMLIGNVGADPEIRYIDNNPQGNTKVASLRLATTERYKTRDGETKEATEWHSVVLWRGLADVVEKYVRKGSTIYVEGSLRTREFIGKDGQKKNAVEIKADSLQLLGKRDSSTQAAPPPQEKPLTPMDIKSKDDDDLPF